MPAFEKLSKDEVATLLQPKDRGKVKSERERILAQYIERLKDLEIGEGLTITLQENENRQTAKNRLKRGAKRLGYEIEFIRSRGHILVYRRA